MHRIDSNGSTADHLFTDGDPSNDIMPTEVSDDWLNDVQENLCKVIETAGIGLVKGDHTQLLHAIAELILASSVSVSPASETVAGILKLATQAQVDAGADDTAAVTSKKLAVRLAALVTALPAPAVVTGASRNLVISSTGTSAAVSLTADELVLKDASGKSILLSNVALSADLIAANIDTGAAVKASTWYAAWVFAKADGASLLRFSESTAAPTLPAGYTLKARVTRIPTDATANKYPIGFIKYGRRFQYRVASGSNLTALPHVSSGVQGSLTTPTLVPTSLAAYLPDTAAKVILSASTSASSGGTWAIAPNNSYGAPNSTTNKPPAVVTVGSGAQITYAATTQVEMLLETPQTIYVASDSASNQLAIFGWEEVE